MRRVVFSLALLVAPAGCGNDSSSTPASPAAPASTGPAGSPAPTAAPGGSAFQRALALKWKEPLTAAEVERYLTLGDFVQARDPAAASAAAQAHGMTLQEASMTVARVGSAYAGLQAKEHGLALPPGLPPESVETVRPFADRIRAMKKSK
jgi:hypothetical protein